MGIRQIQHPGIEINEIDRSGNPAVTVGSNALILGYSDKGEPFSPIQLAGLADYETNFGTPTNEAERYAYYGVKDSLLKGGSVIFSKMPYQNDKSTNYKYVGINFGTGTSVIAEADNDILALGSQTDIAEGLGIAKNVDSLSGDVYNFVDYQTVELSNAGNISMENYDMIKAGGWDTEIADEFILVNETKESITDDNEGLFICLIDMVDGLKVQGMYPLFESLSGNVNVHPFASLNVDEETNIDSLSGFRGLSIPENTIAAQLTAEIKDESVSEQLARLFPTIEFVDNGENIDKAYSNKMGIAICKLFSNETKEGKLDVSILEFYFGSFFEDERDISTGQSVYLPNLINGSSKYVMMYKNQQTCLLPDKNPNTIFVSSNKQAPIIGFTKAESVKKIKGDAIGADMVKTFNKLSNVNEWQVDMVVDCGLSTIAEFCNESSGDWDMDGNPDEDRVMMYNTDWNGVINKGPTGGLQTAGYINLEDEVVTGVAGYYDESENLIMATEKSFLNGGIDKKGNPTFGTKYIYENGTPFEPNIDMEEKLNEIEGNKAELWRAIETEFINFCQYTRKDCMAILDVPRTLGLRGPEKHIRKTRPENTFTNTIGKKLRFLTGLNSSYAALYSDWMKMIDIHTGINFWLPPSCKVAGLYIETDIKYNFWDAPAGLNRGVLSGINDIAFNPNGKEADALYTKSFNYIQKYPLEGFILEGQKTTQVKSSAFDRVNVRRSFLRMERFVYQTMRQFVYETNNIFLRRRVVDVLTPYFNRIKSQGGLYDFKIICDESNNTGEVIDANELKCLIALKPARSVEFIRVDFVATRTNANFSDVISELI